MCALHCEHAWCHRHDKCDSDRSQGAVTAIALPSASVMSRANIHEILTFRYFELKWQSDAGLTVKQHHWFNESCLWVILRWTDAAWMFAQQLRPFCVVFDAVLSQCSFYGQRSGYRCPGRYEPSRQWWCSTLGQHQTNIVSDFLVCCCVTDWMLCVYRRIIWHNDRSPPRWGSILLCNRQEIVAVRTLDSAIPPPLRRATPGSVNHTRKKTASHPSNLRICQEIIYPSAVSRGTWWHVTDTWPIPTVSTQTALPTSHFHFLFQNSLLSTGYGLFDQTKNFLISFSLIWILCSCFPATKNYAETLKPFGLSLVT